MSNCQSDIEEMLATVRKPKKRKKAYKKSQLIKDFELEHIAWYYSDRSTPECVQSKTDFRDDTANNLTKLVIAFLKVRGAFATRLNGTGMYRNDIKKFVPSRQRRGMADIVATYRGRSLNIEVKIGKDKMSVHQAKVKGEIEQAGGYYYIAKDFDTFRQWWIDLFKET